MKQYIPLDLFDLLDRVSLQLPLKRKKKNECGKNEGEFNCYTKQIQSLQLLPFFFAKMRWQCVWGKTSIGYLPLGFLGATAIFVSDEV